MAMVADFAHFQARRKLGLREGTAAEDGDCVAADQSSEEDWGDGNEVDKSDSDPSFSYHIFCALRINLLQFLDRSIVRVAPFTSLKWVMCSLSGGG